MSKVITFSTKFPSYHPRKGEPTYFVEKILYGLIKNEVEGCGTELLKNEWVNIKALNPYEIKHHTIRAGNRWKVGDKFSPRIWGNDVNPKNGRSGPYNSKQIIIAPDIEIKKIWGIKINPLDNGGALCYEVLLNGKYFSHNEYIAANDGLSFEDFENWFDTRKTRKDGFAGQIICWNEKIEY
jgi:hypothetical protein